MKSILILSLVLSSQLFAHLPYGDERQFDRKIRLFEEEVEQALGKVEAARKEVELLKLALQSAQGVQAKGVNNRFQVKLVEMKLNRKIQEIRSLNLDLEKYRIDGEIAELRRKSAQINREDPDKLKWLHERWNTLHCQQWEAKAAIAKLEADYAVWYVEEIQPLVRKRVISLQENWSEEAKKIQAESTLAATEKSLAVCQKERE